MRPERRIAAVGALVVFLGLLPACDRSQSFRRDPSRGKFRQVAHEVEIRPGSSSRSDALMLVQTAQGRLASGDAKSALALAERAVRMNPAMPEGPGVLAQSLEALGRHQEAGAFYRRAAEMPPVQGAHLNNYGAWLCGQRREQESLGWFERAWTTPGYATPDAALANAGACALRLGQAARAAEWSRQALAISPANPVALMTLAQAAFGAGRALEARAFIERRLSAAAADHESLLLASQIEQQLGDTTASTRYLHRLNAEFPRTPESASQGGGR